MILSERVSFVNRPTVATYPPSTTIGPRIQEHFEFVWLMTGTLERSWVNSNDRLLQEPGTLWLIQPGIHEHLRWNDHLSNTAGYIEFEIKPPPDCGNWPLTRPIHAQGLVSGLLDHLLWLAEQPTSDWQAQIERSIAHLLDAFLFSPLPDPAPTPEPAALATALDYIRREWAGSVRPLSLGELATASSVSKEHLARLFRKYFGMGMIKALDLVRLSRAEALLARSNLNVTEIAMTCGYDDLPHFSRRFRETYGMSPRQYRQGSAHPTPLIAAGLLPLARRITGSSGAHPWSTGPSLRHA